MKKARWLEATTAKRHRKESFDMTMEKWKTFADIASGLAAALAIVIGGLWFLWRREGHHILQITMTLRGEVMVKKGNPPTEHTTALVRIKLKNIGHSRITYKDCQVRTWPVDLTELTSPQIHGYEDSKVYSQLIPDHDADQSNGARRSKAFTNVNHLEPGEEVFEDVSYCLDSLTTGFYAVSVVFKPKYFLDLDPHPEKWKWGATALYYRGQQPETESSPEGAAQHAIAL